jgi:hypothetical protein
MGAFVTDEGKWHADVSKDFLKHETVNPWCAPRFTGQVAG